MRILVDADSCGKVRTIARIGKELKVPKSRETTSIRHAMRPHTRKAHWHHYWVGKGRKELVLRWIAPTVVGTGERVATIHRVRNEQEDG